MFLTLCSILTLSQAFSIPGHIPTFPFYTSSPPPPLCEDLRQHCAHVSGSFCPQCDIYGNFLPQQCWPSTGHCWCVNIYTGEEIPNTNTPPGVPPVDCYRTTPEPFTHNPFWYCPDGWSNFHDMCFNFVNTPKKWIEAEVYCQFDGANLASVHSEEQNHFIMSLTRGNTQEFPQTWLGGFDAIYPGYWMWSDGSDFNYENWYNNPSPDDGNTHPRDDDDDDADHDHEEEKRERSCLRMNYEYDLKWFRDSCTDYLPFVCAKRRRGGQHS